MPVQAEKEKSKDGSRGQGAVAPGRGVSPGKRSRTAARYGGHRPASQSASHEPNADPFCSEIGSDANEDGGVREGPSGVGQSLGRQGAAGFSNDELFSGMTDTRHAIEGSQPGSIEANDHEQNLTILQWEASERGFSDSSPGADAATAVTLASGLLVSASSAHLRYLVEEEIRTRGNASRLMGEVREAVLDAEVVGDEVAEEGVNPEAEVGQQERAEDLQQILSVLESQVALVTEHNKAFEAQFRKHAHRTAWSILDESERRVRAEMERYGMSVDRKYGGGGARSMELPEAEPMRAAAAQMATSKRGVDALAKKRAELVSGFGYPNIMSGMPKGESEPGSDAERSQLAAIDAEIDAAELKHVQLRMVLESQYPALARYKSAGDLQRVAKDNGSGPDQMAWDLDENLINIEKARDALASNELDPLTLPEVVGVAKQALMVPSGSMRSRLVNDMVSDAQPSKVRVIAIAAISIGLGLLAIPLSGGSSLSAGTTAALVAVEGVGLGIDAVLLSQSVSEYMVKKAASGTDPDKVRALSQEDPSLGWLAVEILATGVGAGAALKAFRGIVAARRAALETQDVLELKQGLRRLRQLGEGAGLSEGSRRRLVAEVQEQSSVERSKASSRKSAWYDVEPDHDELKAVMGSGHGEALDLIGELRADPKLAARLSELSDDELAAVIGYTDFDYTFLNTALREGDELELERLSSYLRFADDGLLKMPAYQGTVYRGVSLTQEQIRRYVPGQDVVEPALTSTSKFDGTAFGGNVKFIIESKAGRDIEAVSMFGDKEAEVLFRAGTAFSVTSKVMDRDDVVIKMREI